MEIDQQVRATRARMEKGTQGQLERKERLGEIGKVKKMQKWIADLESAPNFKPFWCIICPNRTKIDRVVG